MTNQQVAILVLSCDKYSDMWPVFFKQLRWYFPTEGYKIYLGSNRVACHEPGVVSLLSGDDPDWSTSYKRILAQIPEPKLFVILEDLLLASQVEREGFDAALSFLFDKNALHIKYWASPMPDEPTENTWVGVYRKGAPYRATVCGFWDREYLMGLLIEGENPWDFEILGSYRTSYSDGFYGLTRPLCSYSNMIEKGCWIPESVKWASESGVALDLEKRPMLVGGRHFVSRLQMTYFRTMMRVPWQKRVRMMNMLRKLLISY